MKKTIFTEKRKLTTEEVNAKMDFQTVMKLFYEGQTKPEKLFDSAPMEDFEQIAFKCIMVLTNGELIDEVRFLAYSAN